MALRKKSFYWSSKTCITSIKSLICLQSLIFKKISSQTAECGFCVGFVFIIEGFFQFINSYYINKEFRSPRSTNLRVLRKSFSLKIIIYPTFGAIFLLLDLIYSFFARQAYYYQYGYIYDLYSKILGFYISSILLIFILLVLEN